LGGTGIMRHSIMGVPHSGAITTTLGILHLTTTLFSILTAGGLEILTIDHIGVIGDTEIHTIDQV